MNKINMGGMFLGMELRAKVDKIVPNLTHEQLQKLIKVIEEHTDKVVEILIKNIKEETE